MQISPEMKRHAIYIKSSDAIYTFVPKNACTTLRYAVVMANMSDDQRRWIQKSGESISTTLNQIHTYEASLRQIKSAKYRFIVLRCPWARLSSVFFDKIVGDKRTGRAIRLNAEANRFPKPIAYSLRALHRIGVIPYIDPNRFTFREFVDLISVPSGLGIDHHWTPQARFALDKYDDVFGMHDLKAAFSRISEATGLEIQDTRDMSGHATNRLNKLNDKCYADMPLSELREMKSDGFAPHHAAFFDKQLREKTQRLYQEDIALHKKSFGEKGLTFPV